EDPFSANVRICLNLKVPCQYVRCEEGVQTGNCYERVYLLNDCSPAVVVCSEFSNTACRCNVELCAEVFGQRSFNVLVIDEEHRLYQSNSPQTCNCVSWQEPNPCSVEKPEQQLKDC